MKKFFLGLLAVVVLYAFSLFAVFPSHFSQVSRWNSPDGKYALSVIKRTSYLDLFEFYGRYEIVVGHAGAISSYGHVKSYSFIHGGLDVHGYIQESKVEWGEQGVTFIEKFGHRLFFPVEAYNKGR